jgi:hypothetical protein
MMHRKTVRILNGLGAVFPEFRARPAHASACGNTCLSKYHGCVTGCGSNSQCKWQCLQDYNDCLDSCPP